MLGTCEWFATFHVTNIAQHNDFCTTAQIAPVSIF